MEKEEDLKKQQNSAFFQDSGKTYVNSEGLEDYVVEKIIDSKVLDNGLKIYNVKCVGYKWLTEEKLLPVKHLVQQFNKPQRKRGRPRGRTNKEILKEHEPNTYDEEETKIENPVKTDVLLPHEDDESNERRSKRLKLKNDIINSFVCKTCGKSFRSEEIYLSHRLDHEEDTVTTKKKLTKDLFDVVVSHDGKQTFSCRLCGQTFCDKKSMKSHYDYHDLNNPWYCRICQKHCTSETEFIDHNKMHDKQEFVKCTVCEKYISAENFEIHKDIYCIEKQRVKKNLMKCEFCSKSFDDVTMLKSHMSEDHDKRFICSTCDASFFSKHKLDEHLTTHAQSFQCSVCLMTFTSLEKCTEHATSHEEMLFKCTKCFDSFSLSEDLEMHYRMSDECLDIVCTECNVPFENINELSLHLQSVAKTSVEEGGTVILYLCGYCHRGFHLESTYLEHTELHLSELDKPCPHCGIMFDDIKKIEHHVTSVHNGTVMHPCVECKRLFESELMLNKHVKTAHARELTFRCLICDCTFNTRIQLNRHIFSKVHKNHLYDEMFQRKQTNTLSKTTYNCPICERTFYSMCDLKRHEIQHQRVEVKFKEDHATGGKETEKDLVRPLMHRTSETSHQIDQANYFPVNSIFDQTFTQSVEKQIESKVRSATGISDDNLLAQFNTQFSVDKGGNITLICYKNKDSNDTASKPTPKDVSAKKYIRNATDDVKVDFKTENNFVKKSTVADLRKTNDKITTQSSSKNVENEQLVSRANLVVEVSQQVNGEPSRHNVPQDTSNQLSECDSNAQLECDSNAQLELLTKASVELQNLLEHQRKQYGNPKQSDLNNSIAPHEIICDNVDISENVVASNVIEIAVKAEESSALLCINNDTVVSNSER